MRSADVARASLRAVAANPLRSALTALGVIIGVAAVILMLALGNGAQAQVEGVIERLGSNILMVYNQRNQRSGARGGVGSGAALSYEDALAIRENVAGLRAVDASVRAGVQVVAPTGNWATTANGVTPDHFIARNWEIAAGRLLDDADVRRGAKVAVVGRTVARELFGDADPIGQRIRLNATPFTIVGVTQEKGQSPSGADEDDTVFIPLTTAQMRVTGRGAGRTGRVNLITISIEDDGLIFDKEEEITELLRERHDIRPGEQDHFGVRNLAAFVESRAETTRVFSFMLAGVAAVSLLVGGIGIMNIMLVSVTERTREIGLRMALGARRRDILSQFALEAIGLSMAGGLVGVAIGVGGALMFARVGRFELIVDPLSVLLSFSFAAAIGLVFGAYPARRAAQLDPIEALRRE